MESGMTVTESVKRFEEAEWGTRDARKLAERDRDYYNNKQLTSTEVEALKKRGQPPVVFNRIARKVDYLAGLERQARKDPKAFPRNPDDEKAADAATDALRYVCDDSNWDMVRSDAWQNILVEGTGCIMVGVAQTKKGIDPKLTHIPWDRFYYDPHSSRADFEDAEYLGVVTWMDLDRAKGKFQGKDEALETTYRDAKDTETYDDKPKHNLWADRARRRIRICEEYYRKGDEWWFCIFTQAGYLVDPQPSPYLDENGEPECPLKAQSAYVDRDNNRYGAVRVMIDPQDEINKRRSKGLHLLTMRQARVSQASTMSPEKVRKELAKPDGVLVGEKDDFEVLETADMARGNFEMLQEAKAEIDLLGPNAALAGKNEQEMSGRALLAQQHGGMVEVAMLMDRLRMLSLSVYRAIWNRIRQHWKEERCVRVSDDENKPKFVGLNKPVMVQEAIAQAMQGDEDMAKKVGKLVPMQLLQAAAQGDQQASLQLGMFVQQFGQQVLEVDNDVAQLDVDIVLDEGMDTPTVQAEQFDTLAKLIPAVAPLMQTAPALAKALFLASSLRDKDKILASIEEAMKPSPEAMQMQQMMQQLQMAAAQAEVQKTESEAAKNMAQAQAATIPDAPEAPEDNTAENQFKAIELGLKGQEVEIDAYRADTERMAAMKPEPNRAAA